MNSVNIKKKVKQTIIQNTNIIEYNDILNKFNSKQNSIDKVNKEIRVIVLCSLNDNSKKPSNC